MENLYNKCLFDKMWFNGLRTNSCKDYVVARNLLEKKQINLNIERSESEIIWFFEGSTQFMSLLTTIIPIYTNSRERNGYETTIWEFNASLRKKEWMKQEHTQKILHTHSHKHIHHKYALIKNQLSRAKLKVAKKTLNNY